MAICVFSEAARVAALLQPLSKEHVGAVSEVDGTAWSRRHAPDLELALRLEGEDGTISALRCQAPAATAGDLALLEQYCRACIGLGLEEAAAYAGDYLLHRLGVVFPAMGVRPSVRAIPILALAQDLLRDLCRERRGGTSASQLQAAHALALPPAWIALDDAARLEKARIGLSASLASLGRQADLLRLTAIDRDIRGRPVRCELALSGTIGSADLPDLLRGLEQHLRAHVAPGLELYVEERDDRNQLRQGLLDQEERKVWVMKTQAGVVAGKES